MDGWRDADTERHRLGSRERLADEKPEGFWQDMSESNKGKRYESDAEKGEEKILVWR